MHEGAPVSRSEKIQVSTEEGVREIIIARPETKNSLLVTMYEAFTEALLDAELPGYRAYTQTTRYRLVPGLW